ncbi:hypothetical protein QVD17_39324 [Tagetes erecta]|uniref:Dolichyl-diphosphooligosaccharide--protein glycosyltransferase subunit KCP2 n=1 Tax=Tagetes erecta TaxID=13708 RepID=A0AAD8NH13_TARER|nr:hypothetical protein QVD17_39324 [Tagetes erecta]
MQNHRVGNCVRQARDILGRNRSGLEPPGSDESVTGFFPPLGSNPQYYCLGWAYTIYHFHKPMAESGNSMIYSLLLFVVTLSLQEMYRGKLASSELFTILGGFTSSLVFLFLLTFIGNYQETSGVKTGWGAVILAEAVALVAAGTVHRVCITTCFLFSAVILYEVKKISEVMVSKSEVKGRRH